MRQMHRLGGCLGEVDTVSMVRNLKPLSGETKCGGRSHASIHHSLQVDVMAYQTDPRTQNNSLKLSSEIVSCNLRTIPTSYTKDSRPIRLCRFV